MPVAGSDSYDFTKNEDDPLDIDVIIIDEASMLNVRLFYSLMSAIPREAHVIIVGDVDPAASYRCWIRIERFT